MAGYNYGQQAQRAYKDNEANYATAPQALAAQSTAAMPGSAASQSHLPQAAPPPAAPFQAARNQANQLFDAGFDRSNRRFQVDPTLFNRSDLAFANDLRGRQLQGLDAMQAAYQGPSVAARQYAANMAQAQRQAMGVAAQSRGAGRGAARLQAVSAFGGMAGQQAAQSGALEAEERQRAMLAYQQALSGARQQDAGYAGMGLQRDAALGSAQQGAFDSTTSAQLGALQMALGAGNMGLSAEDAGQRAELERQRIKQQREAAWLNAISGGAMAALTPRK